MKQCYEINDDIHMALLQLRPMADHPEAIKLSYTVIQLTYKRIAAKTQKTTHLHDNDKKNHISLVNRQPNAYVDADIHKIFLFYLQYQL